MNRPFTVTIDGPAGVGKSTIARRVAEALGIAYLDTGAMFRTLALHLGSEAQSLAPEDLARRLEGYSFSLLGAGEKTTLFCNGEKVGQEIRTEEAAMLAARAGAMREVRQSLKKAQQAMGRDVSLVAEGRDMGTEVFPDARYKFFLVADPKVRAERRYLQLQEMGKPADLPLLLAQITERDEADTRRSIAPLRPAEDARIIDTSHMGIDDVFMEIMNQIERS